MKPGGMDNYDAIMMNRVENPHVSTGKLKMADASNRNSQMSVQPTTF